jgi:hypothetical protein
MSLVVTDGDSCMANALNFYFKRRLFTSLSDFQEKQNAMVLRFRIQVSDKFSLTMIDRVQVHHRIYRRKLIFSTRLHRSDSWDYRLPGNHRRAIVDYWPIGDKYFHTETIELSGGKFIFSRYPERMILPRSDLTIADYIDLCYEPNNLNIYLAIYIYVK